MRRTLVYAPRAREDLVAIRRWLMQPGSGLVARQRLTTIRTAVNRLREHPCLYPVVDHPGVRELPCAGGYRALYEVVPDTGSNDTAGDVLVLRVFGPGQNRGLIGLPEVVRAQPPPAPPALCRRGGGQFARLSGRTNEPAL